jgi:hypothetical protein
VLVLSKDRKAKKMSDELKEQCKQSCGDQLLPDENTKWLETVEKAQKRLADEIKFLTERWEKTSLLKQIDNEYAKGIIALLLENQRLINEAMTDAGDIAQFKRVSIPLVRRVYDPKYFVAWDMVSIQALLGPAGIIVCSRPDKFYAEEICAFTKKLKVVFPTPIGLMLEEEPIDVRKPYSLDEEAKALADLAAEICEEFCYEVIRRRQETAARQGRQVGTPT